MKAVSLFVLFLLSSSSFAAADDCGGSTSFPPALPQPQLIMEPVPIGAPVPGSEVTYTFFSRKASRVQCRIRVNMPATISNGYQTIYAPVELQNMSLQWGDCTNNECALYAPGNTGKTSSATVKMSLVYVGPPKSGEFAVQMAANATTQDDASGLRYTWNVSKPLRVEKACQITASTSSVDFGTIANSQFDGPDSGSALKRSASFTVQCGPGTSHLVSFSLQPVGSTFVPSRCVLQPNNNSSIGIALQIGQGSTFLAYGADGKIDWPIAIIAGTTETLTMNASLVKLSSGLPEGAFQAGLNWVADHK